MLIYLIFLRKIVLHAPNGLASRHRTRRVSTPAEGPRRGQGEGGRGLRQGGRARLLRKPERLPVKSPRTLRAKPCPLQPMLLECNSVGAWRWYPECDSAPGMLSGAGASGQADAAYGRECSLSPWCYLAARWILVCLHLRRYKWATSPNRCVQLRARLCLRHGAGENPRPNHKPKESVA
jgi:hypothetical protein